MVVKEIWIPNYKNFKKEKQMILPKANLIKITREFDSISDVLNYASLDELLNTFEPYVSKSYEISLFPTIFEIRLFMIDEEPVKSDLEDLLDLIPRDVTQKVKCVAISVLSYGRKKELINCLVTDMKREEVEDINVENKDVFFNRWDNFLSFMNAVNKDEFEKIKGFIEKF